MKALLPFADIAVVILLPFVIFALRSPFSDLQAHSPLKSLGEKHLFQYSRIYRISS